MAASDTITISAVGASTDWIAIPYSEQPAALLFTWAGTAGSVNLEVGKLDGSAWRDANDENGDPVVIAADDIKVVRRGLAYRVNMTDDASSLLVERTTVGRL